MRKRLMLDVSATVKKAVKEGSLVRPSACELCSNSHFEIVAHHAYGYNRPLDIWWICKSCNRKLAERVFHSGLVTREQARIAINDKVYREQLIKEFYE